MTSESSRMHASVPLVRQAWVARIADLAQVALAKSRQAWMWSRPRLAAAAAATAYHGWRGTRRLRLLSRRVGQLVMTVVNRFDVWWERSTRRSERRAVPPPPPAAVRSAPTLAPTVPRAATQRPTTGSIARVTARPGTGPIVKPIRRNPVGQTTGSIARAGARPTTGTLAKPATGPLIRTDEPVAQRDAGRAAVRPAAISCWNCSSITEVTGARRGGCYYCSRCGKLMAVLDLATGRTRAFTGRGEISADETEPGDD